jgi:DNA-binding IclR family transcriptional regulator
MAGNRQTPLERYIRTLEEIASAHPKGLALTELSRRCGLPAAASYRAIQALMKVGLTVPKPGGGKEYVLGQRLFRLLHAGTDGSWIKISVQPILDRLADALNETCFVAQLSGRRITSIAWAVPESGLRSKVYPGDILPPHAAASAKAILAFQPDNLVSEALGQRLERFTSRTVVDRKQIKSEHTAIRRKGFATCWDEMEIGLGALACPIEVEDVGVQYSVAVTGLTQRLKTHPTSQTVIRLKTSAEQLKQAIYQGVREAENRAAALPTVAR